MAIPEEPVNRLNYGTWFRPVTSIVATHDYWTHTFSLTLPNFKTPQPLPKFCANASDTNCIEITSLIRQIDQTRVDFDKFINYAIYKVEQIIPELDSEIQNKRQTRSWLPVGGSILKKVFGVATQDDLEIIVDHVMALEAQDEQLINAFNKHTKEFTSTMHIMDERIQGAMKGIKQNHNDILQLKNEVSESVNSLRHILLKLQSISTEQIRLALNAERSFALFYQGLLDLVTGKLTPTILPYDYLVHTITQINSLLGKEHPGFTVVLQHLNKFYIDAKPIVTRKGHNIYISVKFPLGSPSSTMKVYDIHTVQVPIKENANHASLLQTNDHYYAISEDHQYYTTITKITLEACQSDTFHHCPSQLPLRPTSFPSCVNSLYFNDKISIKQHCNFTFLYNTIFPHAEALYDNQILLYQIPQYTLKCSDKTVNVKGCNFCVILIPCKCAFVSQFQYIAPSLQKCDQISNISVSSSHTYPVNLAVLSQYFEMSDLKHINSDSLFNEPLSVNTPDFQFSNDSIDNILSQDSNFHMNLAKIVEKSKNNEIIYKTEAETLLHKHLPPLAHSWPTTTDIIALVALIASGFSLAGVLLLFAKGANGSTIPVLSFNPTVTTISQQSDSSPTDDFWYYILTDLASMILTAIIILVLLWYIVKRYYSSLRCSTTLCLEITNGTQCITIPIQKLPNCPRYWHIKSDAYLSDFKVKGKFFRSLEMNFHNLIMENIMTKQILTPPSVISLSPLTALVTQEIIKGQFCAFVFLNHKSYSFYFHICPRECERAHVQVSSSLTHSDSTNNMA